MNKIENGFRFVSKTIGSKLGSQFHKMGLLSIGLLAIFISSLKLKKRTVEPQAGDLQRLDSRIYGIALGLLSVMMLLLLNSISDATAPEIDPLSFQQARGSNFLGKRHLLR